LRGSGGWRLVDGAPQRAHSAAHAGSTAPERQPSSMIALLNQCTALGLACLLLAAGAVQAAEPAASAAAASAVRRGNVLTLRKAAPPAPDHHAEIESFVRRAAAGDVEAVVRVFDELPLRNNGEAAIRHFVTHEVMPFFLDAVRLDDPMRVTTAGFDDGTDGRMAYAYVRTRSGEARPFVIAWRPGVGALRVVDLQMGRCVPARHPVSPGRCDR
jgi:hypothetical protein